MREIPKGTVLAQPVRASSTTFFQHTEENHMTRAMERTTTDLHDEVLNALADRPMFETLRIGVHEADGIVTLTGRVDCYGKRLAAEQTVRAVRGVRSVVNDIQMARDSVFGWRDVDLFEGASHILRSHYLFAGKKIVIGAHRGVVTLSGRVNSYFERFEAERAISSLPSLQGIRNLIDVVPPKIEPDQLRLQIVDALRRVLGDAASAVDVRVMGRNVALVGTVPSWGDKLACRDAAIAMRGVADVEDLLDVG
jgi:osmotically-inducible protein OsmY